MKYEQKSFTVPQQTSKICGCEKCIYGSGEHAEDCRYRLHSFSKMWALETELESRRLARCARKMGVPTPTTGFEDLSEAQPYYEWLLDLKALVVELAEIPQKDGE